MKAIQTVRVSEIEKRTLKKLSSFFGLSVSEIMRLGITQILKQAENDTRHLPVPMQKLIIETRIHQNIRDVKKIRWLNHVKDTAQTWINRLETNNFEGDRRFSVLESMTDSERLTLLSKQKNIIDLVEKWRRL